MRNSFVYLGTLLFGLLVLFFVASIVILIFQWPISMDLNKLSVFGTLGQTIAALVALGIAWSTFFITVRKPRMTLTLPKKVRLEIAPQNTTFYIQPTFSISNVTTRADIITDMWLEVRPIDGSMGRHHDLPHKEQYFKFIWQYVVKFEWDYKSKDEMFGGIISDAVPLPVTLSNPQAPLACFVRLKSDKWWQADASYYLTLYAQSALRKKPLQASVKVKLGEKEIRELEDNISEEWNWVFYTTPITPRQRF
jgi:hypothetical protein